MRKLADLVAGGATVTSADGVSLRLAGATLLSSNHLWYCVLWLENEFARHWLDFDRISIGPGCDMIVVKRKKHLVASIAPFENGEGHFWRWEEWRTAARLHRFVAQLKRVAADGATQSGVRAAEKPQK